MTVDEVLQHDLKFRYMLLGRLQADCEYYLGSATEIPTICGLVMKKGNWST